MTDREKVIKGLETCSDVFYGCKGACSSCAYSQMEKCFGELVYDAIALLKEQEAVTYKVVKAGEKSYPFYDLVCTGCGNKTGMRMDWKYCPGCGRSVKWNE